MEKNDLSCDGKNYREIATIMSMNGHQMNHSSVRNHVIRMMKKFLKAYITKNEVEISTTTFNDVAQSALFQQGIADVLQRISCDTYNSDPDKDVNVKRNPKEPT